MSHHWEWSDNPAYAGRRPEVLKPLCHDQSFDARHPVRPLRHDRPHSRVAAGQRTSGRDDWPALFKLSPHHRSADHIPTTGIRGAPQAWLDRLRNLTPVMTIKPDFCVLCGKLAVGTSTNGFGQQVPRCEDCMPPPHRHVEPPRHIHRWDYCRCGAKVPRVRMTLDRAKAG